MSLSSVTISGTIKKAPEKRFTPTNIPVANFVIEICYIPRGSQTSQNSTAGQTVRVNAWRDLAEQCEQQLKVGDKVLINGRAQINAYVNSEGKKKREVEIDATSVTLLNNVLLVQAPPKSEEKESSSKGTFKKSAPDLEQVSAVDELITNTEEIPF